MRSDTPLVCNMDVFTPAQREAHTLKTTKLIQSVQSVREIGQGYEFTFPSQTELIFRIAEFIANERLCCPFLEFSFKVCSDHDPISLSITGPIGTQEFLRAEFNGAIS